MKQLRFLMLMSCGLHLQPALVMPTFFLQSCRCNAIDFINYSIYFQCFGFDYLGLMYWEYFFLVSDVSKNANCGNQ